MNEQQPFGRDDELWAAIARWQAGESPPAEREALARHLAAHPDRARLVGVLDEAVRAAAAPPAVEVEAALARVLARRERAVVPLRRGYRPALLRLAAALVLALGVGVLWRTLRQAEPPRYVTATGQTRTVRLPDGSTVRLGPESRLEVREYAGERRLSLTGEGYFQVRHGAAPFTVETPAARVRDLGTAFTVRAEASGTRVVVTQGAVAVAAGRGPETVLRAGDRASASPAGRVTVARGAATPDDLAWTEGRLVFRAAPLSEVAGEMARWYGIVVLPDPTLAGRRVTATLPARSTDGALEVVAAVLGARIERHGDTALVVPRGGP